MKLCEHDTYTIVDWIKEPRYHDDCVLIKTQAITKDVDHYIIKFTGCNKYPDWFYMNRQIITSSPTQSNGRGRVYCVPMYKREQFIPNKHCVHQGVLL